MSRPVVDGYKLQPFMAARTMAKIDALQGRLVEPRVLTADEMLRAKIYTVKKRKLEDEFKYFVRYFFKLRKGSSFVFNDHHHEICDWWLAVHRGEKKEVIMNTPPRYSKTEIGIMFVAWCYAKNRRCEFIHLSYSEELVLDNSDAIREIIKSAEYQAFWPVEIRVSKDSKSTWATAEGGVFRATNAGGSVTGFGAGRLDDQEDLPEEDEDAEPEKRFVFSGCIWIDDPLKPDDARSDAERERVNVRWDGTIKSRRNSPRTPTVVTMQRIHPHDFAGMLIKDDTEHRWHVLKQCALIDEGLPTERPLWEAKHDLVALHAMKAKNPQQFGAQMQQDPKALGGNIMRGAWLPRYDPRVVPPLQYRVIYADTAQKTAERNDWTVFACWGKGTDGRIYLLDVLRKKFEAPELLVAAYGFWLKHRAYNKAHTPGALREMKIEDKSSGTGLIQQLKKNDDATGRKAIPVVGIQRDKDKYTRCTDATPSMKAGLVVVPEVTEETLWVTGWVDEHEGFTADDTHMWDDQCDTTFDAVSDMLVLPLGMKISGEAMRGAGVRAH